MSTPLDCREVHILVSWNSAFPSLMLTTFYSGFLGTICAFTGSSIINFSHRVFCFTVICNFAISCYWCHAVANTQLMRILVPFILHRKDTVLLKPGIWWCSVRKPKIAELRFGIFFTLPNCMENLTSDFLSNVIHFSRNDKHLFLLLK